MKFDHNDIDEIIVACLSNKATKIDQVSLEKWLNESEDNRAQFEIMQTVWREKSREPKVINADEVLDEIWEKGTGEKSKPVKKSIDLSYLFKIAAAVLVLLVTTFIFYNYIDSKEGSELPIADVNQKIIKENPAGQKSKIILPDGSEVWLNSASKITYQENFNQQARTINLLGEAFFKVKKDLSRPFIVNTGSIKTIALGTSFNISAYPQDESVEVALITGKVKVLDSAIINEEVILKPNDGVKYNLEDHTLAKMMINSDQVIAWKDGILVFDGENFEQFKRKIENWYGVEVLVEGQVPDNWRIRATFDNEYLTNIMNTISFNKKFNYKLDGKKLVLNF